MSTNATQPDQAEGDDAADKKAAGSKGGGQGVSAQQPAEGSDDAPAGGPGSAE